MTHNRDRTILLLSIATLLTSCTTPQLMTCRSEKTGKVIYYGRVDAETNFAYIVKIADNARDLYPKRICKLHD